MIPYLKTFFEEKQLPYVSWELVDDAGVVHLIDNDVVLEAIGQTGTPEQKAIGDVIRKIDFDNGDVNDYLKHLAGAIINQGD